MGTFWEKSPENMDFWLKRLVNHENDLRAYRLLDYSKQGNVYYLAVEEQDKEAGTTRVTATVLITYRENGELGYKELCERAMPYYFGAAKRILNLLTPTDHPHALQWREECEKHRALKLNSTKANKAFKEGLKKGDVVKLKQGCKPDTVEFHSWQRGNRSFTGYVGLMSYNVKFSYVDVEATLKEKEVACA